jgi:hypothetical protein
MQSMFGPGHASVKFLPGLLGFFTSFFFVLEMDYSGIYSITWINGYAPFPKKPYANRIYVYADRSLRQTAIPSRKKAYA